MKKLLYVSIAVLVANVASVGLSAQAKAYKTQPASERVVRNNAPVNTKFMQSAGWVTEKPEGDSLYDLLNALQDQYKFVWVRGADTDVQFLTRRVCVSQSPKPLVNLIENVLTPAGFTAEFKGELVTVSSNGAPAPKDPVNCTEMITKSQEQPAHSVPAVRYPMRQAETIQRPLAPIQQQQWTSRMPALTYGPDNSFPAPLVAPVAYAYDPRPDMKMAEQRAIIQDLGFGNLTRGSAAIPTYNYGGGFARSGYGYGGGYGYSYYFNCQLYPGDRRCTHGPLHIDAQSDAVNREGNLQGIDLYVDGDNYGPVSKYNRWPNKANPIPVGRHTVQFVQISRKTGAQSLVYETTTNIRSYYEMGGESNILRLDASRMFNAPFRAAITHVNTTAEAPEAVLPSPRQR